MKKTMIAVLCITALVLNAVIVAAAAQSYTEPKSMTRTGGVAVGRTQIRGIEGCNIDIQTSPEDTYFIGKARKECVEKNKHNLHCQNRCYEQVKLLTRGGGRFGQVIGAYSRYGCKDIDAKMMLASSTASRCYFDATNECAIVNPGNDYCRKKCVQKTYSVCRQNSYQAGSYR